jgi:hypothetical protein
LFSDGILSAGDDDGLAVSDPHRCIGLLTLIRKWTFHRERFPQSIGDTGVNVKVIVPSSAIWGVTSRMIPISMVIGTMIWSVV